MGWRYNEQDQKTHTGWRVTPLDLYQLYTAPLKFVYVQIELDLDLVTKPKKY